MTEACIKADDTEAEASEASVVHLFTVKLLVQINIYNSLQQFF